MKRQPRKTRRPLQVIRLWTRPQAETVLPLIRSIMQSLREHWIEARAQHQRGQRLAHKPGRPNRQAILAQQFASAASERAEDCFNDALAELMDLGIFCLDPGRGLALIPFDQENELAWFVYDLFAPEGMPAWRYHRDPLEARRSMTVFAPLPEIKAVA